MFAARLEFRTHVSQAPRLITEIRTCSQRVTNHLSFQEEKFQRSTGRLANSSLPVKQFQVDISFIWKSQKFDFLSPYLYFLHISF